MLQLAQPIWLWAISGIIVPLIIHLWNIKKGKVLKVGSISFLQNSAKQHSKSFKVNEWPLLLLRCLLIILSSFLLAQPFWNKSTNKKEKGWLLMDKQGFNIGYKKYKPMIDSLLKNDFSLHYFEDDFANTTLEAALKDTVLKIDNQTNSYWDLISQLNNKISSDLPVYLITSNQLRHFNGNKPAVQNNIEWLTYAMPDSIGKHIVKAFLSSDDSIDLMVTNSTPSSNSFLYETLPLKTQSINDYTITSQKGKLAVKNKTDTIILVDTSTLKIVVYAQENSNDATFLKAAISSIQNFTKRKITLQNIKDASDISTTTDWLFWLSSKQIPDNIIVKNVFAYAVGKEENKSSWINTLASNVGNNNIQLLKETVPVKVTNISTLIWQDGFGNPILTKEIKNQSTIFNFYNHFDPAWSNLVWDNNFPLLLASILFKQDSIGTFIDKRTIDEQQLQPVIQPLSNRQITLPNANKSDISNLFWLSIFIVFLIERFVSFRTNKAEL